MTNLDCIDRHVRTKYTKKERRWRISREGQINIITLALEHEKLFCPNSDLIPIWEAKLKELKG